MSFNSIDHEARKYKKKKQNFDTRIITKKKEKRRKKKSKKQKNKTGKKNGVLGVNIKRKVYDIKYYCILRVCVI